MSSGVKLGGFCCVNQPTEDFNPVTERRSKYVCPRSNPSHSTFKHDAPSTHQTLPLRYRRFPGRDIKSGDVNREHKVSFDCTVLTLSNKYRLPFPVGSLVAHSSYSPHARWNGDRKWQTIFVKQYEPYICMKNAYTISRLINDMLKNVILRDTSPCCSHLTMSMGAAYPSNTSASPYRTTRVVPKVMSNFFFCMRTGNSRRRRVRW